MAGRRKNQGIFGLFFYAKGIYHGEKCSGKFRVHREYPAFFRSTRSGAPARAGGHASRPWPPTATYSGNDYVQRLKDTVRESAVVDVDTGKDPNEVVRAMVVTDVPAAVEQTGGVDYTAAAQSAESKTLRSQESVIRQARRITGRSVINQSGYLVSAFSMDMTRAQMKQVAALDGVVSVSEVTSYQARMTSAKEMTSDMELWKAENGGNTGEGIVVAVIDSGVNYSHPDMQMRQDAQLKFTRCSPMARSCRRARTW